MGPGLPMTAMINARDRRYRLVIAVALFVCGLSLAWALLASRQAQSAPDFTRLWSPDMAYRRLSWASLISV